MEKRGGGEILDLHDVEFAHSYERWILVSDRLTMRHLPVKANMIYPGINKLRIENARENVAVNGATIEMSVHISGN